MHDVNDGEIDVEAEKEIRVDGLMELTDLCDLCILCDLGSVVGDSLGSLRHLERLTSLRLHNCDEIWAADDPAAWTQAVACLVSLQVLYCPRSRWKNISGSKKRSRNRGLQES